MVEVTVYLRHDDVVEITEEARLLSEDVVWRCGVGDSQSSGQGRVGAERQGEVVLPQEREKRRGLTREELQSHGSTWQTRGKDNDVGFVVLGCVDEVLVSPLTSFPVHGQHDFAVRAFSQQLQDLEVRRCVHRCQRLSRQMAHLIQKLCGCLDTHTHTYREQNECICMKVLEISAG